VPQLYEQTKRASVEILVDGHHAGSGCFVAEEGLVITAAHVIGRPGREVEVLTSDGSRLRADVVAVDLGHDLALLRVPTRDGGYQTLKLAGAIPPPGTDVFLCSAVAFRHKVLQRGMIARDGLTFEHQGHFVEVIHIAAMVQEGTSGGPWVNRQGELMGVQSGSITNKSAPGGIANAAPIQAVKSLLDKRRNASTSTIGVFVDEVWVLPPDQLRRFPPGTEGMFIQTLQADGPTARSGIKKGDVVTAVDKCLVRLRDDFVRLIRAKPPGQTIELTVLGPDGTGTRQVVVTIGKLEVAWPETPASHE
jgi:serine protease Do